MKTRIILVGGFLGAGKTTLLGASAQKLSKQGKRVGLITNDQASGLVDTAFLERINDQVAEVSGSCFCCNFNGFSEALLSLRTTQEVDIIIAEPVGSCTDLSATVVQPLKEKFKEDFLVSPLSVLVDPKRLQALLEGQTSGLHASAAYILQKQLDEADMIVITKTDLLSLEDRENLKKRAEQRWPLSTIFALSAKSGEGLEHWLQEATCRLDAGKRLIEVDYDVYAEGEAVLGWLNAIFVLGGQALHWESVAQNVLQGLAARFDESHLAVGHVKLLIEAGTDCVIGNVTGLRESLEIRGSAKRGNQAKMTLNARVETTPFHLERIISEVLSEVCEGQMTYKNETFKCLQPGRPNPTYRYRNVVK
jgi:G3E family GTPase